MGLPNAVNANLEQPKIKSQFEATHTEFNDKGEAIEVVDKDRNTWGVINQQHFKYLNNPHTHKALDFSNVNIYGENNNGNYSAGDEYDMRRFHQMVIYTGMGPNSTIITSNLPERIQYSLNSVWQEPLSFNSALTNLFFQAQSSLTGNQIKSGINRAGTIRIWGGTQPLSMSVTIPVLDDNENASGANLVEALDELGKLCLPGYVADGYGFYMPPPNPLSLKVKYSSAWLDSNKEKETGKPDTKEVKISSNWKRIMIQLGGVLLIDSCVIESISVDYPDTKTMVQHDYSNEELRKKLGDSSSGYRFLHPLLANVTIKFSTVEAVTHNRYNAMLWAKPQGASFTADFTITQNNYFNGQPPPPEDETPPTQ